MAFATLRGRGNASGMATEMHAAHVWEFRGERIARHEFIVSTDRVRAERERAGVGS